MVSVNFQIIPLLVIVFGLFQYSNALKCYVCNSVFHLNCDSPPSIDYLVECEDSTAQPTSKAPLTPKYDLEPPPESLRNYTFCRKTVAWIPRQDNKVVVREAEKRTVRSCGWLEPESTDVCKWGSTDGVQREMCTCRTPKCNSASTLKLTLLTTIILLVFIVFRIYC